MEIGITYNLKSDVSVRPDAPIDALEEYDSEGTIEAIATALRRQGHAVRRLGYGRPMLEGLLERRPDLVFNLAEGVGARSREAQVPAVLEMLGVPYTHSDPLTLAVTHDKAVAKRIVASHGLPTPRFHAARHLGDLDALDLRFPMLAKPLFEGSSMGLRQDSRVDDRDALAAHVTRLLGDYDQPVLVEEFCTGPEFTVAILGTGDGARVLGTRAMRPLRVPEASFVYSIEVKRSERWTEEVAFDIPPRHAPALVAEVERVALGAYRALDCRDVGRVDVRVSAEGVPCFLELNALPGLSPAWSELALIANAMKLSYDDLIATIVDEARGRYGL